MMRRRMLRGVSAMRGAMQIARSRPFIRTGCAENFLAETVDSIGGE